jgi:prepilin-type N-terminal cleavage/methylation domain-containing protein
MMDRPDRPPLVRLTEDGGFSLVELMVVLAVMGIVMTVFLGLLASVQRSMVRETNRSTTMDQARLAMEAIDRDVRSGNVLCVQSSGSVLKVYTQSNGTASTPARWIKYSWAPSQPNSPYPDQRLPTLRRQQYLSGAWQPTGLGRTVASGLLSSAPFQLDPALVYGSRVVNVTLLVQPPDSNDSTSSNVQLVSSIAIRNQSSANDCSQAPPG